MAEMTFDEWKQQQKAIRANPQEFLSQYNRRIEHDPTDADAYYDRHKIWMLLGRDDLALDDLNKVLSLHPHALNFRRRGNFFRSLGRYREALEDFDSAERMDPEDFPYAWGLLFRADCHARLGDLQSALADCRRLRDDHWTPGLLGAPAGDKRQVAAEIRRRAVLAQPRSDSRG